MSLVEPRKLSVVSWFRGFVFSCLSMAVLSAQSPSASDPDLVERGRQTFVRVGCYQCHGREAQGASTGPRLGPNPLPRAVFARAVRTPRNDMPPYSVKILSDRELEDVYVFVTARPAPARPR